MDFDLVSTWSARTGGSALQVYGGLTQAATAPSRPAPLRLLLVKPFEGMGTTLGAYDVSTFEEIIVNLKIVIVEDNTDTRFMLSELLKTAGDDVRAVGSIGAALGQFDSAPAHVLISDMGLPDGSGQELMQRLHILGHHPYGIAITGYGASSDIEASLAAGYQHHLVKPIEIDDLNQLIDLVRRGFEGASPP